MYHLTKYERETIINFNNGEATASVYTYNRALRRRLEQLAQERPGDCHMAKVTHFDQAVEYYIPKSWIKINPTRILSDEQRTAMAEHARNRLVSQNFKTITGVQEHMHAGTGKDIPKDQDIEKDA